MTWETAWVTGASSGIGLHLARLLAAETRTVALSARSADKLKRETGKDSTLAAYPLDVTDAKAVADCIREIEKAKGPIDLAVLNAGIMHIIDCEELDLKKIRAALEVNYMGVVNCLDALVPRMIKRGRGHIAIMGSVSGYRGLPRAIAYGPTKAALISLAETLHVELKPHGINVQVINPGFVDTPLTKNNTFPMPAIIPVEEAAQRILAGLKSEKFEIAFPRAFVYLMKSLRRTSNTIYFWAMRTFVVPNSR